MSNRRTPRKRVAATGLAAFPIRPLVLEYPSVTAEDYARPLDRKKPYQRSSEAGADGVARWAADAEWAAGPAPDDQRDAPMVLSLSEGFGRTALPLRTNRVGNEARGECRNCQQVPGAERLSLRCW